MGNLIMHSTWLHLVGQKSFVRKISKKWKKSWKFKNIPKKSIFFYTAWCIAFINRLKIRNPSTEKLKKNPGIQPSHAWVDPTKVFCIQLDVNRTNSRMKIYWMLEANIWKNIFQKFQISIREKTASQTVKWITTPFEIQASFILDGWKIVLSR